uniref:RanBP-type and C3HC4-type zinc finger-containing protein 1 n=1 Tax=Timema tahoe TaxID=61484 RepID=A0A7R9FIZ9_9NEOP|nr:unnamed protein product [Timema tahoe]
MVSYNEDGEEENAKERDGNEECRMKTARDVKKEMGETDNIKCARVSPRPIQCDDTRVISGGEDVLYIVSFHTVQAEVEEKNQGAQDNHQHYQQLVNLDNTDLVPNVEPFDCPVCLVPYEGREGVVLRDCLHTFCRMCLANTVAFNEEAEVKCPYRDADYACDSVLQEREIKALVAPAVYEQHLAKSVAQAENKIGNTFHCKTADCKGWCIFEDNVNEFRCPVCRRFNCLTCQAIHEGLNCRQYQEQVKQESETNADARRTKEMLEATVSSSNLVLQEMVDRGEAMACPTCQVVLMKKWGCDWLRCSMCKTEICWVTRGPRWGPGGKGDTTGGCQCGVNGVKCHPRCNYCH